MLEPTPLAMEHRQHAGRLRPGASRRSSPSRGVSLGEDLSRLPNQVGPCDGSDDAVHGTVARKSPLLIHVADSVNSPTWIPPSADLPASRNTSPIWKSRGCCLTAPHLETASFSIVGNGAWRLLPAAGVGVAMATDVSAVPAVAISGTARMPRKDTRASE